MSVVEDRKISQLDDGDALGTDSLIPVVQNPATNPKLVRVAVVRLAALFGGILRAGDTMLGFLTLYAAPTQALHAATKAYVDGGDAGNLALSAQRLNNLSDLPSAALARSNLSLGNVDNTSDLTKPLSTADIAALALKAPLASPTFTGIVTTAGQIAFPATANPSTDVNTLDDYEEGTSTLTFVGATIAGTFTYTQQIFSYTKVGNVVTGRGYLRTTAQSVAPTGDLQIVGLPFACANTAAGSAGTISSFDGLTFTGFTHIAVETVPNTNKLVIVTGGSGVSAINLPGTGKAAAALIVFTITYNV